VTTGTPRKPPVFGPEPWSELAGRSWSYWDLWFAAVAVSDHAGSLDELEAHLVGGLRNLLGGRQSVEAGGESSGLPSRALATTLPGAYWRRHRRQDPRPAAEAPRRPGFGRSLMSGEEVDRAVRRIEARRPDLNMVGAPGLPEWEPPAVGRGGGDQPGLSARQGPSRGLLQVMARDGLVTVMRPGPSSSPSPSDGEPARHARAKTGCAEGSLRR